MANFVSGLAQTAVRAAPFAAKVLADKQARDAAQRKELLAQLHQQSVDNTAQVDAMIRAGLGVANIGKLNAETLKLREPTPDKPKPGDFDILDTEGGFVRVPRAGDPGPVVGPDGQPLKKRVVAPAQPRDSYAFPTVMGPNGEPVVARANTRTGAIEPTDIGAKPSTTGGRSSATITKAIAQNQQTLSYIDKAIKAVKEHPEAFGLEHGRGLPVIGGIIDQRLDPAGIDARSLVANIGSQQIHDRTGAAMSIHEEKRLNPFVPGGSDTPQKILANLEQLKAGLVENNDALEHSGTPVGGAAGAGSLPPLSDADRAHAQRDPAFAAWLKSKGYQVP